MTILCNVSRKSLSAPRGNQSPLMVLKDPQQTRGTPPTSYQEGTLPGPWGAPSTAGGDETHKSCSPSYFPGSLSLNSTFPSAPLETSSHYARPIPSWSHQSSSMTQKIPQIHPSSPGTATLAQTVTILAPAGPPASCSRHQHPPQRGKRIILNHKPHTWVLFTVPQSHRGQVQMPQRAPQGTTNVFPAMQPPLNDKVKKDPR